jgi:hypothetical protein
MRQNKFKAQISVCKIIASIFRDSEETLLLKFLERGADIKEVRTTNSQGSAKQEDESSPPPA